MYLYSKICKNIKLKESLKRLIEIKFGWSSKDSWAALTLALESLALIGSAWQQPITCLSSKSTAHGMFKREDWEVAHLHKLIEKEYENHTIQMPVDLGRETSGERVLPVTSVQNHSGWDTDGLLHHLAQPYKCLLK